MATGGNTSSRARLATVAMANKTARIVWATMTRGEVYQAFHMPMPASSTEG
jgi:transposase